jgi:hypothetical protein
MIKLTFSIIVFSSILSASDVDIEKDKYIKAITAQYISETDDKIIIGMGILDVIEKGMLKDNTLITALKNNKKEVDGFGNAIYETASSTQQNGAPIFYYKVIVDVNGIIIFMGRKYTAFTK